MAHDFTIRVPNGIWSKRYIVTFTEDDLLLFSRHLLQYHTESNVLIHHQIINCISSNLDGITLSNLMIERALTKTRQILDKYLIFNFNCRTTDDIEI